MPAILKILVVLFGVLGTGRRRVPLGAALIAGSVVLNLWAGLGWLRSLRNLGASFVAAELWLLLAVTVLIVELGRFMTQGDNARTLTAAVRRWGGAHGSALSLMALPAAIGLVPMPAGALFSAPFVEQTSGATDSSPEWKSAVNYWFRHVWEYWWPLYPGVIVSITIFEMETWRFMAIQFPFTLVTVTAGFVFLVRPHMQRLAETTGLGHAVPDDRRAAFLMVPLLLVVAAALALPPGIEAVCPDMQPQIVKLCAVLAGLLVANAVILFDNRCYEGRWPTLRSIGRDLANGKNLNVLVTLGGVLIFKNMLEHAGLLPEASRELLATRIPPQCAVALLPFLAGIVTGIAVGFTGASFPLVVGLMSHSAGNMTPLATLVLAYGFGYMGMMLSPVHLCLLVTRDYFKGNMGGIYRRILPCALTVALYSLSLHLVLHALAL